MKKRLAQVPDRFEHRYRNNVHNYQKRKTPANQ